MRTKILVRLCWLAAVASLPTFTSPLTAAPVGTAFTYQGRLDDAGQPANGRYDLKS